MKLIILGAGYFQTDLVKKAKSLGYETHVFGKGDTHNQTIAGKFADYYYPISVLDQQGILKVAKEIKPDGITTMGADIVVQTMAFLNQELGLVGNSSQSALWSTNKYEMKKRFKEYDVPTADFIFVGADYNPNDLPFKLPVIVKAVDKAGKLGITKVEVIEQLKPAIEYGIAESQASDKVLVEEFVEGKEYSMEGMSWDGRHGFLSFTEKFNIPPHFVEEMHLQPAPLDCEFEISAWDTIKRALEVLGIKNGPSHTEFKVTPEGEIRIIEIGARMAAESMWEVVQISTGRDYMRMAIDNAVGNDLDWNLIQEPSPVGLVKFVITKEDFVKLEKNKALQPETISRIDTIVPYVEGAAITHNLDRYGYYLLRCQSREQALELTQPQYQ